MVRKHEIDEAIAEVVAFMKDICEKICDDDADCIRKCRGEGLIKIGQLIQAIDPRKISPDQLKDRVETLKRDFKMEHF